MPSKSDSTSLTCKEQELNILGQLDTSTSANNSEVNANRVDDKEANDYAGERVKTSGVLFGIDAGFSYHDATSFSFSDGFYDGDRSGVGYLLGLRLGYQVAFTKSIGMRLYVGDSFSFSTSYAINSLLANLDFYYNFTRKWGIYVGGGSGVQSLFDVRAITSSASMASGGVNVDSTSSSSITIPTPQIQKRNSYIYSGNFGIEYLPGKKVGKNIIALGVTVVSPTSANYVIQTSGNSIDAGSVVLQNYIFTFGYTHVF
ncbi:hypothetical protein [Helicobacter sp. 13S00401-1]|uniref:hypothetical protein n=1 Tax=Helicobacter sp. 13S00401-1 TaxID=1905758 RepID=UPI001179B4AB|nr:hypothetical protein [Helicobacter sp. 13S00401-1]